MTTFTAGYDRLKRLFHKVNGNNWQEKIQQLSQLSKGQGSNHSNLLEIRTFVKGLCEEIAQHAKVVNDTQTFKLLSEFLACLGHASNDVMTKLSEINAIKDKTKKQHALLQLLLSNEVQHHLAEQLRLYFSRDEALAGSLAEKQRYLSKALEQRMARCMDKITVLNNQASYDDTGRIVQGIMDIITLLMDVLLINFGFKPAFSDDMEHSAGGHKPQTIMPMPMKM